MIRNRSMLACVAIVATVGVGLPGLVAATAGASTEPPPPAPADRRRRRRPAAGRHGPGRWRADDDHESRHHGRQR